MEISEGVIRLGLRPRRITPSSISIILHIGVRAGGARGAAAPPNFGQLRFFGQQEKTWAKPVFKDVSTFYYYYYFEEINIFYLTRGRRNNSVTFTRDSVCLAHDEFLVIREGYHMLIFCFVGHCTSPVSYTHLTLPTIYSV